MLHSTTPAHPRRPLLTVTVIGALVALLLVVPTPRSLAAAPAPTGTLALGKGLGGRVDARTGQFSLAVPVVDVPGVGQAGIAFSLTWQQERATASIDRSGWGAGWSLGTSFVSTNGVKRVFPANGGSFAVDASQPRGMANYKLKDLVFTQLPAPQTLRARTGATSVAYWYTLVYDDGRTDYFDVNGNLVARADRFGNRTDLSWQARPNGVWRPLTITDSYGRVTTFGYPNQTTVTVTSPTRSDGVVPVTTIILSSTLAVQSVTDAAGNTSTFASSTVGGSPKPLLTTLTSATGARTVLTYQQPSYEPGLVAVQSVKITDGSGTQLSPTQTFDLDPTLPAGGNNRHNYTGYPNHLPAGGNDTLFDSGDAGYLYSTGLTNGGTTTVSTFDALHRLVKRTISVVPAVGQAPVAAQTHVMSYPTAVVQPALLPANYARKTGVAYTASSATSLAGITASTPRTTKIATGYDDHGRVISSTDEAGAVTTTTYGAYGLVTQKTTTAADGSIAKTVNTLTGSGPAAVVGTSTTSVAQSGQTPTARQVISYSYDGSGQVTSRSLAWAPGAKPAADGPGGGPDRITTTYQRSVSTDLSTVALVTTVGAGTPAAQTSTATVDTVLGRAVAYADGLGRVTRFGYDAIGRPTTVTAPDGLTTSIAYTATSTTRTSPDGRMIKTTTDLLGRTVAVTDNVANQALTKDPTSRTLHAASFSTDGSTTTTTDRMGRQLTTVVDPFGRVVSHTTASGIAKVTSYDDGLAHSATTSVIPDGSSQPLSTTATSYDDLGRTLQSSTVYPTGPQAKVKAKALTLTPAGLLSTTSYNGLGQPSAASGNDLRLSVDRSGPGGTSTSSTVEPETDNPLPGDAITATTVSSLSGAAVSRTLSSGDQTSPAVAYTYNAAGQIVSATDPGGRVTSYTYAADGQLATKTMPSGAVTTNTYDSKTGLLSKVSVTSPNAATRTVSYTRVPAGQLGAGKIKTITDGTDTITYGYDVDGHRTSVVYPDQTSTSATYNDKSQLVTSTDITGAVTTYAYDTGEQTLVSAVQKRGSVVLASVSYTYDAMDRVQTTKRGNGIVTTYAYTADQRLASQITTNATNTVLESHAYTYDDRGNVATRVDSSLSGGSAAVPGGGTTWSTVYSYNAFNQLIGSAVYAGGLTAGKPSGPASTQTAYTVDVGGDVTATKVTLRSSGVRPTAKTTTTTYAIDDSGRLTQRTVGASTANQTFDTDGRVLASWSGTKNTYTADGAIATTTAPDGATTTYARWPDGTLRSASTTATDGTVRSVSYHYTTDGQLANDSTADASTSAGRTTSASYLQTTSREARTLLPGATSSGGAGATPATPVTAGAGTGYYLRDRHNSVVAMVDSAGATTATYAYADYGLAARYDGRPATVGQLDGGRSNPFEYLGAAAKGPLTDAGTSRLIFAQRLYDPATGRFTSPDPVDAHNRYQGFRSNPISYSDVSGGITVFDAVMDALMATAFLVTAVLTAGTGVIPAAAAILAADAAAVEISGAAIASVVSGSLSIAANLAGTVTSAALAADDVKALTSSNGKGFFDTQTRGVWASVNTAVSVLAGFAGGVQGVTASGVSTMEAATVASNDTNLVNSLDADFVNVADDAPAPGPDDQEPQQPPAGPEVPLPEVDPPPAVVGDLGVARVEPPQNQQPVLAAQLQEPVPAVHQAVHADPVPGPMADELPSVSEQPAAEDEKVIRDPLVGASNLAEKNVDGVLEDKNSLVNPGVTRDGIELIAAQPDKVDNTITNSTLPLDEVLSTYANPNVLVTSPLPPPD